MYVVGQGEHVGKLAYVYDNAHRLQPHWSVHAPWGLLNDPQVAQVSEMNPIGMSALYAQKYEECCDLLEAAKTAQTAIGVGVSNEAYWGNVQSTLRRMHVIST